MERSKTAGCPFSPGLVNAASERHVTQYGTDVNMAVCIAVIAKEVRVSAL